MENLERIIGDDWKKYNLVNIDDLDMEEENKVFDYLRNESVLVLDNEKGILRILLKIEFVRGYLKRGLGRGDLELRGRDGVKEILDCGSGGNYYGDRNKLEELFWYMVDEFDFEEMVDMYWKIFMLDGMGEYGRGIEESGDYLKFIYFNRMG